MNYTIDDIDALCEFISRHAAGRCEIGILYGSYSLLPLDQKYLKEIESMETSGMHQLLSLPNSSRLWEVATVTFV